MSLLMGFTREGAQLTVAIKETGLKFVVTEVAFGTSGYNISDPSSPLPLQVDATSLVNEVVRKPVLEHEILLDTIELPRGKETVWTTLSFLDYQGIVGEAGLYAVVTDPALSGLALGYKFLLAHAHFGRVTSVYGRKLTIKWPLQFNRPLFSSLEENFEHGTGWSGTLPNHQVFPDPDFVQVINETFEDGTGWSNTLPNGKIFPTITFTANLVENFESGSGWSGT